MSYSLLRKLATLCIFLGALQLGVAADLHQQLQNARLLLDQPTPDSPALTNLMRELKEQVLSGSAGQWTDSACVTIAEISKVTSADPDGFRWALELCLEDPDAPWMKYALKHVWPISGTPVEKLEVADALLDRADMHRDEAWAKQYKARLFRAYASEEFWSPAAYLGAELLKQGYSLAPDDRLVLANSLLRSNQVESAREVLFALANSAAPNTPQALRAGVELGLIEQVLHRDIQAKQQFEQAWATWEKFRKRDGFDQPDAVRAAARARWELLQFEFAALEKTFHVSLEWSAKEASKWCNDFDKRSQQLLLLAPDYDAAVAVLSGRVQRLQGDALFKLGMYSSRQEDMQKRDKLLTAALDSYDEAADLFVLTTQRETALIPPLAEGHWSALTNNFKQEAAQHAYDVYAHAANQLAMWSTALWEKTPLKSFGLNGYSPRFDGIVHAAFPVLTKAAAYRKQARRFALQHRDVQNADVSQFTLYADFVKPVEELRKLCGSQWHATASSATQISRTLATTHNPDAVASMSETITSQLSEAHKLADESSGALEQLFSLLFSSVPQRDSLAQLAQHSLALNREYAEMNRTVHESLDLATNSLDRRDPQAAGLRSKLYKFSAQAADRELETLEAGHKWAESNGFLQQGGKDLYARLAERDPGRYPLRGGVLQAGR
ncbi:MAG: hypothetical protein H6506_02970 [Calditrichaeota bacterium]|nr:hypothetical protein [Calditrichota bacterium]MCB9391597.1 hypothetical protein [Calditrichota bacterium]